MYGEKHLACVQARICAAGDHLVEITSASGAWWRRALEREGRAPPSAVQDTRPSMRKIVPIENASHFRRFLPASKHGNAAYFCPRQSTATQHAAGDAPGHSADTESFGALIKQYAGQSQVNRGVRVKVPGKHFTGLSQDEQKVDYWVFAMEFREHHAFVSHAKAWGQVHTGPGIRFVSEDDAVDDPDQP